MNYIYMIVEFNITALESQLANCIVDVCDIDKRFYILDGLNDLSRKLVVTRKRFSYPLVFA